MQGGRKLILDGGTQVNTKKNILKNLPAFSNFYSTKPQKMGVPRYPRYPQFRPPCAHVKKILDLLLIWVDLRIQNLG